jgi:hypothetical protein
MHLLQRRNRIAKILESRPADDEIEGIRRERQRVRITALKPNLYSGLLGILGCDPDKGRADIQTGDPVRAEPCQLDRQISGTRSDFQNMSAERQAIGDRPAQLRNSPRSPRVSFAYQLATKPSIASPL